MFGLSQSDEQLAIQALNGSARAWTKLVQRYERKVYNHALRMTGHADDALDLMQDAFLAAYRNLPNYRGDGASWRTHCGQSATRSVALSWPNLRARR